MRPRHEVGPALVEHTIAVPIGDDRRADLAAVGADDADRVPCLRVLHVGDALVDLAHEARTIESRPDERIHVARRVVLAHPVVAVREDAETRERVDEGLGVVASV